MKYHSFLNLFNSGRSNNQHQTFLRRARSLQKRVSRLEQLEERMLLSVTTAEYADIRTAYAEFDLPESMEDINVIEITADNLSSANIRAAISQAGTTSGDDLLVLRTEVGKNRVSYVSNIDELQVTFDSEVYGKLTIAAYGASSLTVDASGVSRVLTVGEKTELQIGNLILTGGNSAKAALSAGYGGALYNAGTLAASSLTVTDSFSSYSGGGIFNSGTLKLRNTKVTENTAVSSYYAKGGGIYSSGAITAENILVADNSAEGTDSRGGGIYLWYGSFNAVGATIAANSAANGGAFYLFGSATSNYTVSLDNSILVENSAAESGNDVYRYNNKGTISGRYVLTSSSEWDYSAFLFSYDSSKSLFSDPVSGDYSLKEKSQAIDIGNNDYVVTTRDVAGNERIFNNIVDLGAYEYHTGVKPSITDVSVDGWIGEYDGLAHTITVNDPKAATDTILYTYQGETSYILPEFVDPGAYTVDVTISRTGYQDWTGSATVTIKGLLVTTNLDVVDETDGLLSLREAIAMVETGTAGTKQILFSSDVFTGGESNCITLTQGELVISKSLSISAASLAESVTIDADGKSRVLKISCASETETVSLTDLVITGGTHSESTGAGILVSGSGTLFLNRCVITDNTAQTGSGGGLYQESGVVSAVNSVFSANSAGIGGGIYVGGGTFQAVNCTIAANSAANYGGGVANWGTILLTNTIVSKNCGVLQNADWFGLGPDTLSSNNLIGFDAKFTVNPAFDEEGNLTNSDSFDLSLSSSSWGIDRGSNSGISETIDLAGEARVVQGWASAATVDIGAYEYQESLVREVESPSLTVTTLLDLVDDTDGLVSLREAILYAEEGDTVLFSEDLAGGTIFLSDGALMVDKQLTVDASALEEGITLDGNSNTTVLIVSGGTKETPIFLKKISLTNGASYDGGGIINSGGALSISDCAVTACDASYGAGIFNFKGIVTCTNVTFSKNTTASALYTYYGTVSINDCTFTGNKGTRGAAVYNSGGTVAIANSSLTDNGATYGGAIQNVTGTMTISGSTIAKNGAYYGGGICNSGTVTIKDSVISENNSYYNGGGVYNYTGTLNTTNVLMYGNTGGFGGAVCVDEGVFNSINCTITGNDSNYGGGIMAYGAASEEEEEAMSYAVVLCNTIVVANTAVYGADIHRYNTAGTVKGAVSLSSFTEWDNAAAGGNLVYDSSRRLFCDPDNGDYQLASGSQALDVGENDFVAGVTKDLSGNTRIINEIVDLGCYEFQRTIETPSAVVTTDLDVVDDCDGLISLREAVLYVESGKVSETTITFDSLLSGKSIKLDSDLGAITVSKPMTIDASKLSGGITVSGGGKVRVFRTEVNTEESPLVLISIVVTGGAASDGAGILNTGFLQMTDCLVVGNAASGKGGGIYDFGGSISLVNTTITGNTASAGSGLWAVSVSSVSSYSVQFQNSILAENILAEGASAEDPNIGKADSYGNLYAFNTLSTYTAWDNASAEGVTNYQYDPEISLFADAETGNYSLAADSQAIDLGKNDFISLTSDLLAEPRVVNGTVDLGAYEYLFNADPGDIYSLAETVQFTDAAYSRREMIGNGLYGDKDVDFYAIEVGADDLTRIFSIAVSQPNSGTLLDTLIRVFNAEGEELGNSGDTPILSWTPTETGTFYFAVSALANDSYDPAQVDQRVSGETGDYLLNISYRERTPMESVVLSDTYLAVGSILSCTYEPENATVGWQWTRGKDPDSMEVIEGANSYYYEVTANDVGYFIGVQVTGYASYVGAVTAVTEGVVPEYEKSLVVDTLLDVVADDGLTSLREAIAYAEVGDTITFDSSLDGGTIQLNDYVLTINKLINIDASSLENGISLSASNNHSVLFVAAGELGTSVKLTNITIRDGNAMYGGGIYNTGYLDLVNSRVINCTAYYGGGIYNLRSWDSATSYSTGYVALIHSAVELCTAVYGGGGIWNQAGIVSLKYGTLANNESQLGGGIYNYYGSCSTNEALITGNTATRYGGGVFVDQGSFYIMGATIAGNSAAYGGGVYNYSSESYKYSVEFWNTLVVENSATKEGADIYCSGEGDVFAYNAMSSFSLWTNTASQSYVSYVYDSSKPLFANLSAGDYSLAEDSQAIDLGNNSYAIYDKDIAGNDRISNGIVDLGAYEYQFEIHKTELESVSILYDTEDLEVGTQISASVLPAEAADSVLWQWYRRSITSSEMILIEGAEDSVYTVTEEDVNCYLAVSATGTGDYTGNVTAATETWVQEPVDMTVVTTTDDVVDLTDELVSLREAVLYAEEGTVITFDSSLQGGTITLDADLGSLVITKSITIDASALCNPVTSAPRLTVDAAATTGESRRVFDITGSKDELLTVSIIGLKITGGRSETAAEEDENVQADGGGIYAKYVTLTLDRCNVTKNVARSSSVGGSSFATGGGIYFSGGTLTVSNCTVTANSVYAYSELGTAETLGGGIWADGTVVINKSTISSHYASAGAGIYLESGSLTFTGSTLSNNSAKIESDAEDNVAAYGGGLYAVSGEVIFRSSTVTQNTVSAISVSGTANAYGGGLYLDTATLLMEDVIVSENSVSAETGDSTAVALGGGIYSQASVNLIDTSIIVNTVYAEGDAAEAAGGAVSLIGEMTASGLTAAGNDVAAVSGGSPTSVGGGLYLYAGSLTLKNSIVAENSSINGADIFCRSGVVVNGLNTLSSFSDWSNASSEGVINYLYDASLPLFMNESDYDYSLADDSQAINLGNNDYARYADGTVISRDLAGEKRIVESIVDLGAYEYQNGEITQLDTPEGVMTFSGGGHSIQVTWNAVLNASGYEVAYSTDSATWKTQDVSGTAVTIGSLPYRTVVQFKVRAIGDGFDYSDSEFSVVAEQLVCPMDINGDGDISNPDRAYLVRAWLTEEGDDDFIAAADINGDGEVNGLDRAYLAANWLLDTEDPDLKYPPENGELTDQYFEDFFNEDFVSGLDF